MCGISGKFHETSRECQCHSYYVRPRVKESVEEIVPKEERIKILEDYQRFLEKELESVKEELKSLKED